MPPKRKRSANDRGSVDGGESRPSPHRPQNTNLAQHDRGSDMREGGGRRSSRGGQGGTRGGGRRNDGRDNPNKLSVSARATPTPGPMSPPTPKPSSAAHTPTPGLEVSSPAARPDPAPFDYTFLTDERISSWETSGRQEVVAAGIQIRQDEDTMDLATIFQELTRATLDVRLDATDAGNCVREILGPDTASADESTGAFDPQTFFIDTLCMVCDSEPFNPVLRAFTVATQISPITLRQKLDGLLTQNLGLTRDTFGRVGIRQATHLLYRQANYNLLREETEGYSKLITELFTTSGSEPPSAEVVEETFEKVKGLIGTFDLDVGRVLDILLDVFAAVLIKHFRFFIKLLRVSSWWPRNGEIDRDAAGRLGGLPKWALPDSPGWTSTDEDEEISKQQRSSRDTAFWARAREVGLDAFYELGGRQVVDAETKRRILNGTGDGDAELDADRQWIEETGTFPPSGNRIAAQLLGFKLRFYASPARDNDDILPANLIYLTALLIKIGFISLKDLYSHLWPLDEDMESVRETKMKELQEKEKLNRPGGGAANALMMAGSLPDDTAPNGGRTRDATVKADPAVKAPADVEDKDKLAEPLDQKVQLLTNLLTIGAIPESLFILGRFPWLPEAYPELLELIHRILNHSIQDVYDKIRPTPTLGPDCPNKIVADIDQNGVPKGQVRVVQIPSRKQLRWPFPAKFDTNENLSYRFYWDEWADNVPVCQSVDDIFTLCSTLLNYSGVNIGRDASLLSKLAQIGVKSLSEDSSSNNLDRWQDLLKRLLVPALSLTKSNTSVVNEIYDMLRFYPVSVRYSIYAEWFEGQISRLPSMKIAFARTRLETLGVLKRISLTNITAMARSLAKTAYASPGVVFGVALSQIESYTNLTEAVVECAKYFTDLGYDVLVWSLMSSLGGKDRNRTNAEFALLPSRWLLALSRFSGKVFKRYSIMNLSPILQYVNDQLYRGNSTDLVILKELIAQMAGVVPDTDFTDAQLTAMTGGELLRRQTLINLQDKRYESAKTAKRLLRALTETNLAGQLLILIAQHRQSAIYAISDEDAHIKLIATMIDDSQSILSQYLDLLRSNLSVEEFDKHVPSIPELLTEFGLGPSLAFMIGRASLADQISKLPSPALNGTVKSPRQLSDSLTVKVDADGDVGMESGNEVQANGQPSTISKEVLESGYSAVKDEEQMADVVETSPQSTMEIELAASSDPFHEILDPIVVTVESLQPEDSWNAISPEFYATFWSSTLGDLSVPGSSYEAEIHRVGEEQKAVMRDRTDMTRPGMIRKEEAKKALDLTKNDLIAEFSKQVSTYKERKARILKRKSLWFKNNVKADIVSDSILEKCLIPRLLLSPSDADYCFRMIKFLHENGTPGFRTLSLYGRIFKAHRLRSMIFTCTVREAENLGRFLRLILIDLARWHADSAVYEKEAWGPSKNLPGFAKATENDGTPKGFLDHDGNLGFKNILLHWHKNLNTALRDCFDGTEWMHVRNAITILKAVVTVFPAIDFMGKNFIKQLEVITKREKDVREDLSLTGNAVLVQLKKKLNTWVMVQAFGYSLAEGQQNDNARQGTPQSNSAKSFLKPTATEFKPQSRASSLGVSTPKVPATTEVEDGEVDDAKVSAAAANTNTSNSAALADASKENKPSTSAAPAASEPQKSEVLARRDQILREKEAKAVAATQQASKPGRTDSSRITTPGPLSDRSSSHNLPNRPDAPFPSRHMLERHPSTRHGDRRDGRDSRLPDAGRLERPGERSRELSSSDRRGPEPGLRDFGRASERDRVRPDPPPRWTPESARENAERAANNSRVADTSGRLSRDNVMPPPRSLGTFPDRGPPMNSDRLPLLDSERQELINPERAALINEGNEPPRSDSPRRARDELRDRPSPRPQSPKRYNSDREHSEPRRNGSGDAYVSRGRPEEAQPPAGPRSDRTADRTSERISSDRPRDASAFQPTPSSSRVIDPDHGRLNSNTRQQPDPNFGRLNPTPVSDIPSGPRDRNARGNRMPNVPQPRRDGRLPADLPRPPTPEKQVPTGPSSTRHPRRSNSGQFDQPSTTAGSMPSTPVVASPAAGIHPDRLKHLGPQAIQSPQPSQPTTPTLATGIHPDRLKAFNENQPTPSTNQLNNHRSRPSMPSVVTAGPPSGPKGVQSSPISSGPNVLSAPTGPASAVERAARGGRRQLAGINTMLQQAGQQNTPDRINVRGRGGKIGSTAYPETPTSAPSTPVIPPPPPPPAGRPDAVRELVNPERADLITGSAPPSDERERDRGGRRERSGRHSRRSSRSPVASDRKDAREYRDRRGGEREPERERHSGREQGKEVVAGRDPAVRESGRDRDRDRERDRESARREGRERETGGRDMHDAGWRGTAEGGDRSSDRGSGVRSRDIRGDPPRGDDRRGERRDDNGRKRRSEEGAMEGRYDKKPRR